jgi:lipid-A-disaccharide synthase
MNNPSPHIMLVAGEASGDLFGSYLAQELNALDPNLTLSGIGGIQMKKAGVKIEADLTKMAMIGVTEVIKHYFTLKDVFNSFLKKIKEQRPQAVILIDFPGFNLRLAKEIKALGIKVIYYISPKVWAWNEQRVAAIKRHVDLMLVVFPFEKDFYAKFDYAVTFVGHPLMDQMKVETSKPEFLETNGLDDDKLTLGLLPGSRRGEIERLLPVMLQTASVLSKEFPQLQFLLPQAPTIDRTLLDQYIQPSGLPIKIIENQTYDCINACDICLVASGTATLETALLEKPMVVVYKTSLVTWLIGKNVVKIPRISLVNIMAGKCVVPELLQFQATAPRLAKALKDIFTDDKRRDEMKAELRSIKKSFGTQKASQRAAQEILKFIHG